MNSEPAKLKPKPGDTDFIVSKYRNELPQLSGDLFLTDAGLETDLIFNHGIEIVVFNVHTQLLSGTAVGLYPLGSTVLASHWCSRWNRVARLKRWWSAISLPRSQVSDL